MLTKSFSRHYPAELLRFFAFRPIWNVTVSNSYSTFSKASYAIKASKAPKQIPKAHESEKVSKQIQKAHESEKVPKRIPKARKSKKVSKQIPKAHESEKVSKQISKAHESEKVAKRIPKARKSEKVLKQIPKAHESEKVSKQIPKAHESEKVSKRIPKARKSKKVSKRISKARKNKKMSVSRLSKKSRKKRTLNFVNGDTKLVASKTIGFGHVGHFFKALESGNTERMSLMFSNMISYYVKVRQSYMSKVDADNSIRFQYSELLFFLKRILHSRLMHDQEIDWERRVYDLMRIHGVECSFFFYLQLLRSYAYRNKIQNGEWIVEAVKNDRIKPNQEMLERYSYMYLVLKKVYLAESIFDRMERMEFQLRNPVKCYSSLVRGYASLDKVTEAEAVLENKFESKKLKPDYLALASLVNAHLRLGNLGAAENIIQRMYRWGYQPNSRTMYAIIRSLVTIGGEKLTIAENMVRQMESEKIVENPENMVRQMENEDIMENPELFPEIFADKDLPPSDIFIYNSLLHGHISNADTEAVLRVVQKMERQNVQPNYITYSKLIAHATISLGMAAARNLVDEMTERTGTKPDLVLRLILLRGYALNLEVENAWREYELLQNEMALQQKDIPQHAFNILLNMYIKMRSKHGIAKVLQEMGRLRIEPNSFILTTLLKESLLQCDLGRASLIYQEHFLRKRDSNDFMSEIRAYVLFLTYYARRGESTKVQQIFKQTESKIKQAQLPASKANEALKFAWTGYLNSYVERGDMKTAEHLFEVMQKQGHQPTVAPYTALLKGWAKEMNTEKIRELWESMQKNGVAPNKYTWKVISNFVNIKEM